MPVGMNGRELTLGQLAALVEAAAKQVDPTIDTKLRTLAQVGVGYMKRAIQDVHAVDTGTMLNSTSAESSGKHTILIGPTVTYAPYVALGTEHMAARPFHITTKNLLQADIREFMSAEDIGL